MNKPNLLTWAVLTGIVMLLFLARPIERAITVQNKVIPTPITELPFYTDGFDKGISDWIQFHFTREEKKIFDKEAPIDTRSGSLQFNINIPKTYIYLFNNQFTYDDVQVEAQFVNHGKNTNYVSLVCRYDPYAGWYEFNVSNAGQVAILRYSNERDYVWIGAGGLESIKPGINNLMIQCQGDALSLFVNGVKWRTYHDGNYQRGAIGLSVGSENALPVNVEFSWIKISALPDTKAEPFISYQDELIKPICTDWWDCASKTPKPKNPIFSRWGKAGGSSGNLSDPWSYKQAWINENEWRTERTEIIWNYLCQIDGCPPVKDLSAYLLCQEGSILQDDQVGMEIMVKAFKYKFSTETFLGMHDMEYTGDGITISDLSFFTPFFNPEYDGVIFSDADWKALTTRPDPVYFEMVNKFWDDVPYPIVNRDGGIVDHWWVDGEKTAGNWLLYYTAHNASGFPILSFGS